MRRAKLNVTYNGTDISADITDRLISFAYNDNEQGKADDIEITVHNRDGIWIRDWYPDKGAKLKAGLTLADWKEKGNSLSVNFGVFAIDELTAASGGTFTIKAIAAVCEKAFKNEKKYKTWENATLREIISSIAADNGLQLVWRADEGKTFDCVYQIEQTDAGFIAHQAANMGLKVKISEEKIIIYEDSIGDSGVTLQPHDLSSYSFQSKTFGVYDSCKVSYLNPETNAVYYFVHVDPKMAKTKALVIDKQAKNDEDAKRIAKAELKRHNEREITASISLMGNPSLWSGQEVTLKGFGVFDGVYILDSVKHSIDRGGYKTSAELHIKK